MVSGLTVADEVVGDATEGRLASQRASRQAFHEGVDRLGVGLWLRTGRLRPVPNERVRHIVGASSGVDRRRSGETVVSRMHFIVELTRQQRVCLALQ